MEGGALSTKVTDRVWTILLDVGHTEVADPLKGLNHTKAEKDDVFKMIKSIHKTMLGLNEKTCSETDLQELFDVFWTKDLAPTIAALRAQGPPEPHVKPDIQSETLGLVREIATRSRTESRTGCCCLTIWDFLMKPTLSARRMVSARFTEVATISGSAAPTIKSAMQPVSSNAARVVAATNSPRVSRAPAARSSSVTNRRCQGVRSIPAVALMVSTPRRYRYRCP